MNFKPISDVYQPWLDLNETTYDYQNLVGLKLLTVNCSPGSNESDLCTEQGINEYPSFVFYRDRIQKPQYPDFQAPRSLSSLTTLLACYVSEFGQIELKTDPDHPDTKYYSDIGMFYDGSEIKDVTEIKFRLIRCCKKLK